MHIFGYEIDFIWFHIYMSFYYLLGIDLADSIASYTVVSMERTPYPRLHGFTLLSLYFNSCLDFYLMKVYKFNLKRCSNLCKHNVSFIWYQCI